MKPKKLTAELKEVFEQDLLNLKTYMKSLPENSDEKKELSEKRLPGLEKLITALFH